MELLLCIALKNNFFRPAKQIQFWLPFGLPKCAPELPKACFWDLQLSTLLRDSAFCFSSTFWKMHPLSSLFMVFEGAAFRVRSSNNPKNMFFVVVFDRLFFRLFRPHFFRFWRVRGTSEIDTDPPKTMIPLERGCIFQKIMFLLLKINSSKKYTKTHSNTFPTSLVFGDFGLPVAPRELPKSSRRAPWLLRPLSWLQNDTSGNDSGENFVNFKQILRWFGSTF